MSKKKILIVDDEVSFTWLLKMNLEDTGSYDVYVENDPRQAITSLRRHGPDLIILDVEMPGLHGDELAERIRMEEAHKDTPLIFLTATQSETTLRRIDHLIRQQRVFTKPVNVEEIIEVIETAFLS
jgi:CheY-like chemotaxis protein